MKKNADIVVRVANTSDFKYAETIVQELTISAQQRGVQIAQRTPAYIQQKMRDGLSIIAYHKETQAWIGFCLLEVWTHQMYVANSGLIIHPSYRGLGIANLLKVKNFELATNQYPQAKIFSLSANPSVIQSNLKLGYTIVPYSILLQDKNFHQGNECWVDYAQLMNSYGKQGEHIAMIYQPVFKKNGLKQVISTAFLSRKIKSFKKKLALVS